MNEDRLEKRYQRERQARKTAEKLLEQKSLKLFQRNQELQSLKDSLEKQVLERTSEAEKAKTEAHSANQAKSQFLANMSHEMRTPLTAIIGFSEFILQHRPNQKETEEYLTTIISSGRHLSTLLGEVRKLYPNAELPRFYYEQQSANELTMYYLSSRHFEDLAVGLITGCLAFFDVTGTVSKTDAKYRGEEAVAINIKLN